ncbi:MAG: TonB-dependent receptor [Bacteroidales bacterium]|nr:TonB-dependent receptor [Bacteroidales bacterium]
MKRITILIFTLLALGLQAQQGTIRGRVVDSHSGENIEYATVALLNPADSTLRSGTVTEQNGTFSLKAPYGRYLLRITFIGYQPHYHTSPVELSAERQTLNIGKIKIAPSATMMEAVEVVAERSMVEYQLDKRVVNVDKNIVAGGGTASDVLEQVPSVAVDNDGNVTLRGSTNVKVLVNGRPSELLASDLATLLEQIPASTVENIEVITNPSAKYDPEGMSGIINIKLKDRTTGALGLNGVVNANVGAPLPFLIPDDLPSFIPTAMGNISLNYTTEKYNLTLNADGGLRQWSSRSVNDIARKAGGAETSHDSLLTSSRNPNRMGSIKVGFEYFIDTTSSILMSYQLRGGTRSRRATVHSHDLYSAGLYDYTQRDSNDNSHTNQVLNLHYDKRFARPEQALSVDVAYSWRHGGGDGWQQQLYPNTTANLERYYLRETERDDHGQDLNLQLNYTHPFSASLKMEAGYEGRLRWSDQRYNYWYTRYNSADSLVRTPEESSNMNYIYNQQTHAIYATLAWKATDRLALQAGLRGEYWAVYGIDNLHPDQAPVAKNRPDPYPTLHMSYQINKAQSLQLSYSRRVHRPHMWDLNPYLDVRQGMEMSFGNPGLDPEFTNAFELSYNLGFEKTNIFASAYFRQTNNMMTHYGFVWDAASAAHYAPWIIYNPEYDGYWASTGQNLNRGLNYGLELIVDQQITPWWKINVSLNAFESLIEGTSLLDNQGDSLFRVDAKLNSYMNLPHDWTIQLSAQYRSPFHDLQTEMHASYWVDLAVKKDILNHRGTINLRVSDVFCTGGWGHTTHTEQLDRVFQARRISPTVTVGFSWKINNGLRPQRRQGMDMDDESEGMEEG